MSSLSCLIRAIFTTTPAKLGRMLLIVILTMQSVVAMADDCSLAHDDCTDNVVLITELKDDVIASADLCDPQSVSHVEDDCTECSNNCCSCCMTLMHPVTALTSMTASPNSHLFAFSSTSVESPYFAFLRPPKALIV
ncbi:hypothetical protein AB4298_12065 [Shewanella sp. 10N.261.52.F9]|uniref:hypothetical protein n=1 Tax=Shewanella TaxID=22 RepID=UPI0020100A44|nr:hypothetical protein [Shewanella marinintestina]MCL1148179.1 hypothetical protein [Shewanella marinintestina]